MVIESDALMFRLPVAPAPNAEIDPPSVSVNCPRRKERSPAVPAPNAREPMIPDWRVRLGVWITIRLPVLAEKFSL